MAELNLWLVLLLLIIAAILGDGVNYFLGKTIGAKVLQWKIGKRQLVKQKYIDQTQAFYEKHGSKTIIIARFVPIVRTFAPFVAGIGAMSYSKFLKFNIIGGIAWVCGLTLLGYFFGNLSFVQKNFELVIFGIIGLSLVPMVFEILRAKIGSK
jgi:membrane-associated protein